MKSNKPQPYFLFDFDNSAISDQDQLEKFYRYWFDKFKNNSTNDYTIHEKYPQLLEQHKNTGFLLSVSVSKGLKPILIYMNCIVNDSKPHRNNKKLKSFIYQDGIVKNNQNLTMRVVRAVKEYNNDNCRIVKYGDENFVLLHYFINKQKSASSNQKLIFTSIQNKLSTEAQKASFSEALNEQSPVNHIKQSQPTLNKQSIESQNKESTTETLKKQMQQQQVPPFQDQHLLKNEGLQNNSENENHERKQQKKPIQLFSSLKVEGGIEEEDEVQENLDQKECKIQKQRVMIKQEYQELDEKTKIQVLLDEINYIKNKYEKQEIEKQIKNNEIQVNQQIIIKELEKQILIKYLEDIKQNNIQKYSEKSSKENPIVLDE